MGQYYKGSKIGTCESMYYLRLDQAQELAKQGAKDDDGISFQTYLTDNATMFRFPFPNEDKKADKLVEISNYAPSFKLPCDEMLDVDHREKCVRVDGEGVNGANVFIPCPYSKEWQDNPLKTSTGGFGETYLLVKMEAMRDGKKSTIFECPYCGAMFRMDKKSIKELKERATEHFKHLDMTGKNPEYQGDQERYDEAMEIIKRIT